MVFVKLPILLSNEEDDEVVFIYINSYHIASIMEEIHQVEQTKVVHSIVNTVDNNEYYVPISPEQIFKTIEDEQSKHNRWNFNSN